MRSEIVFIVLGIGMILLSGYIIWIMELPTELVSPMIMAIGGGIMIGVGIMWGRSNRLEEALRGMQESAKPRGMRLMMPWDDEVLRLMVARSAPMVMSLFRERVEGVRERGGRR